MNLSRKLTERYPHSAAAYCLRGSLACSLRQYGEATSAFHTAVGIQPRSADAHFGLGLVEGAQGHFAAALPHLQRCAELEPDSFIPYVFSKRFRFKAWVAKRKAGDTLRRRPNLGPLLY